MFYWTVPVVLKSTSLRIQLAYALFSCALLKRIFSVVPLGSKGLRQSLKSLSNQRPKSKWNFFLAPFHFLPEEGINAFDMGWVKLSIKAVYFNEEL